LPALKKSGNASVVLFSTVAVQSGFGFHSIVSASKGAIEGMARALAAELAPAIRVNVVAPSLTDTPLAAQILSNEERRAANALKHPLRRLGEAADIASAAKYLLSKESAWVTGQVLHVDGGMGALR
jgi:NAD(P)-dependent dehydrogenase (short-subunit alcohol dehydrogenase family)